MASPAALANLDHEDEFIVFQHRNHRGSPDKTEKFQTSHPLCASPWPWLNNLLPAELARFSLDLIHSTDFIPPLRSTHPAVITVHDLAFVHWPHFVTKIALAIMARSTVPFSRPNISLCPVKAPRPIWSASSASQTTGQCHLRGGRSSLQAHCLWKRHARFVHERFGIPASYIFFVSTIEPRKNVNGLLQAYRILLDNYNVRTKRPGPGRQRRLALRRDHGIWSRN